MLALDMCEQMEGGHFSAGHCRKLNLGYQNEGHIRRAGVLLPNLVSASQPQGQPERGHLGGSAHGPRRTLRHCRYSIVIYSIETLIVM